MLSIMFYLCLLAILLVATRTILDTPAVRFKRAFGVWPGKIHDTVSQIDAVAAANLQKLEKLHKQAEEATTKINRNLQPTLWTEGTEETEGLICQLRDILWEIQSAREKRAEIIQMAEFYGHSL